MIIDCTHEIIDPFSGDLIHVDRQLVCRQATVPA